MTNTIYFHNTIRDDESVVSTTTEDEETPPTSNRYTHQQDEGGELKYSNSKEFSLNEVKTATRKFHNDHILGKLGKGGFGRVFKGWIDEKKLSATKPGEGLNPEDEDGQLEYSNSKEFSFKEIIAAIRPCHIIGENLYWRVYKGWIDEIRDIPRLYHHGGKLGKGSSGSVFKGSINEERLTATNPGKGIPVAIKRFEHKDYLYSGDRVVSRYWDNGQSEWQAEVNYLGRFYHPNLVRLLGYCSHNEELILVYEFMSRGSLDDHLFKRMNYTPLSWSVRMKIALEAAKGLAFLHSAPINVIHRGFTSSNILLDKDYNAKLSDFRLAMDGPTGDESPIDLWEFEIDHDMEMDFNEYPAPPEYLGTDNLTAKRDVFSFGVVLLEMLSGRRAVDKCRPNGEHSLVEWVMVEWAKPYLNYKRKIYRVLDSRLEGQYSLEGAQKAANLALQCLSRRGKFRPNMDDVVKALEELQDSKDILPQ